MKKLLLFLGFISIGASAFSADYYVSPTGSDSDPGTSGSPWLTLQFSVDQLSPGDKLHVMAGTYYEKFSINVSGAPGLPIEIVGDFGASINGLGQTNQDAMIYIEDQSYLYIADLEIMNNQMNDAQGIAVVGHCVGITIRSCNFHEIHFSDNPLDTANETTNAQPIIVLGTNPTQAISDLKIEYNTIFNCRLGYSEALAVNGNVTNFSVEGNYIYYVSNIGIAIIGHEGTSSDPLTDQARYGTVERNQVIQCRSPYANCAGIYVDGARDILIDQNSTRLNNYGIEVGCEHPGKAASDILVRNNMVYQNDYCGILAGGYDFGGLSGKVERVKVYNNTLFKNDSLQDGNGELAISYLETGDFQNNILFTNDQGRAITVSDTSSGLFFDYNLYYNVEEDSSNLFETTIAGYDIIGFQQLGFDQNSIFGDPIFGYMNGSTVDDNYFSMGFNMMSPAVDHGNPNFTETEFGYGDFYQSMRVWGPIVDIGASELWFESLTEYEKDAMILYPNPANQELYLKEEKFTEYVIYDLQGKVIGSGKIENAVIRVDTLVNGSYLIRLSGSEESILNRFTKCH